MGIKSYTVSFNGKETRFWKVIIDTLNVPTGRRVRKQISNISSEAKATRIDRELWTKLRKEIPEFLNVRTWGKLKNIYLDKCYEKTRDRVLGGFSPQGLESKRSRLKHTIPWDSMGISGVTAHFVRSELDRMERENLISRSMVCEVLKECKVVMNFAVEIGMLTANPLSMVSLKSNKKRGTCLTREEANKLLHEAKFRSHPFYPIWLMSIFTGLRRSELAGLKWTDIDWNTRLAVIERQNIPGEGIVNKLKDGEDRVVALHQDLMSELKKLKLKNQSQFVIELSEEDARFSNAWKRGEQSLILKKFCREIGIKEVTHHQLRATFITLALADNIPLGKVKELAGHSSLEITDIYFRRSGITLMGAVDRMNIKIPSDGGEVIPLIVSHD